MKTSCTIVVHIVQPKVHTADHMVWSKDENVPSRPYFYIHPVRFRIYEKMRKWDGKREGVYPARICGILFLAGIIPYL